MRVISKSLACLHASLWGLFFADCGVASVICCEELFVMLTYEQNATAAVQRSISMRTGEGCHAVRPTRRQSARAGGLLS